MDVTLEMRKAVYELDCTEKGHIFDTNKIFKFELANTDTHLSIPKIDITPTGELPVIRCTRCGNVWLVIPMEFGGYDQAEARLYDQLKPESKLAKIISRLRGKRGQDGEAQQAEQD